MGGNSRAKRSANLRGLISLVIAAACLAVALGGCGGGSSSTTGSVGVESAKTVANSSPSTSDAASRNSSEKKAGGEPAPNKKARKRGVPLVEFGLKVSDLTTANTCQGRNISPAISWGKLPPQTKELAIFMTRAKPVGGKLYFVWAIAGVDPDLHGLKAGAVPKGAVVGRSSAGHLGYALCPKNSKPEEYVVSAFVLPHSLAAKQGFNPIALREQATGMAAEAGLAGATFPK